MLHIYFTDAGYLWLLAAVLPGVAVLWYVSLRLRGVARKKYGEPRLVDRFTREPSRRLEVIELCAWLLVMVLLVVASAGPMRPDIPQKAKTGSLQVMLLLDVSKSSYAEDYRAVMPGPGGSDGTQVLGPHGSRLDMAKLVIESKIMDAIADNQIGIVTYSGGAFPQAPLTDDFEALRFVLEQWLVVTTPGAPGSGSYMVAGLEMALDIFNKRPDPNKQKVLIIFSDGGFSDKLDELDKLLPEIVKRNIRVIVVGLGGSNPVYIPEYVQGADGLYQFKRWSTQGQGDSAKLVSTAYDPAILEHIAQATGGELIRLEKPEDLNIKWAVKIAGSKTMLRSTPVFRYLLGAALLIILALALQGFAKRKDVIS